MNSEKSKLDQSIQAKEEGDEHFRKGNFKIAIEQYMVCLNVDTEQECLIFCGVRTGVDDVLPG